MQWNVTEISYMHRSMLYIASRITAISTGPQASETALSHAVQYEFLRLEGHVMWVTVKCHANEWISWHRSAATSWGAWDRMAIKGWNEPHRQSGGNRQLDGSIGCISCKSWRLHDGCDAVGASGDVHWTGTTTPTDPSTKCHVTPKKKFGQSNKVIEQKCVKSL